MVSQKSYVTRSPTATLGRGQGPLLDLSVRAQATGAEQGFPQGQ